MTFRGPCVVSIFLLIYFQQDATLHSLFISGKLLYMFRVVSPPILRSTQLYLQHLVLIKPLLLPVTIYTFKVNTVVCAPDGGWRHHPKHEEQFSEINKPCNVASWWKYIRRQRTFRLHKMRDICNYTKMRYVLKKDSSALR